MSLGSYAPNFIPATLSVQFSSSAGNLLFTFPLPLPGSPLCALSVSHDTSSAKGVRVDLHLVDEMSDITGISSLEGREELVKDAEEYLRRGGGVSVVGRVWQRVKNRSETMIIS